MVAYSNRGDDGAGNTSSSNNRPGFRVVLRLRGLGVSLVDGSPKELVYASVAGVAAEFSTNPLAGEDSAVLTLSHAQVRL